MNSELLRESLRSHADEAPSGTALLDAVRTRSRRIRRHRRVMATGAAAVAVAAAIAAPVVLWQPADQPAPPAPANTVDPAGDALVPPSYELPDFPFTPSWVPDGLSEGRYYYAREYLELKHEVPERPIMFMSVRIHAEDPGSWLARFGSDITEQEITVRGQDVLLGTGITDESVPEEVPDNRITAVSWSYEPGRWVSVLGHNGFGADDVLRYAEALTEQPVPAQPAFTFDLLPPGAEPTDVNSSGMSFAPPGAGPAALPDLSTPSTGHLTVGLHAGRIDQVLVADCYSRVEFYEECEDRPQEPVQVGDHQGVLIGTDTMVVYLEDDLSLVVTAWEVFSLSREDLLRLVAGIHLTEYAQPAGGA